MKKKIISLLWVWLLLFCCIARSQNITRVQYFFDIDPGAGLAGNGGFINVPIPFDSVHINANISVAGLSIGAHALYVRLQYDNGTWGFWASYPFTINAPITNQQIVSGEAFFDSDPGIGNGIPVSLPVAAADSVNFSSQVLVPVNQPGGIHYAYLRLLDAGGRWSLHQRVQYNGGIFNTYYADTDSDSYGNLYDSIQTFSLTPPSGYVTDHTDCNDNNKNIHPLAPELCNGLDDDCNYIIDDGVQNTYYTDSDGDGYGANIPNYACTQPPGTSLNNLDCDDFNPDIHPGASEICNGIDDNCDGLIDDADPLITGQGVYFADNDGDGYGAGPVILACVQPPHTSTNNMDCNDATSAINPGVYEVCNGYDDDCDGAIDDADLSVIGQDIYYADNDSDGYGTFIPVYACVQPPHTSTNNLDCNDLFSNIHPGATELCNGLDDNCDGQFDEGFIHSVSPVSVISNAPLNQICKSTNVQFTILGGMLGTGAHWAWYSGSCGGKLEGSSITSSFIIKPKSTTTYFVRAEGGACPSAVTCASIPITILTAASIGKINFSGTIPTTACVGSSPFTLTTNAVTGATYYYWTGSAGTLFNGSPGPFQTSVPNVNVSFTALPVSGKSWSVQVYAGNNCFKSNTDGATILGIIESPKSITCSTCTQGNLVCQNTSQTFTIGSLVNEASSYQWSVTGDATLSGNGNQSITVSFGPAWTMGSLSVVSQLSCGYNSSYPANIALTSTTSTPQPITGTATPCINTDYIYSIPKVSYAIGYLWTSNIGTTSFLTTNPESNANFTSISSGTICVSAFSSCFNASTPRCKGIQPIEYPIIYGFSPLNGQAGATVVITGTHFTGVNSVKFNGGAAATFTVNLNTQITATVPAGAVTGPITVSHFGCAAISPGNFVRLNTTAPSVTGFNPNNGCAGDAVVITGTNFGGATGVSLGGIPCNSFTINSATKITATLPQWAASGKISVTNNIGTGTSANTFQSLSSPILSFTPVSAQIGGSVAITGTNFKAGSTVKFNGANAVFTINNSSLITATVPSGAITGPITITHNGCTSTSASNFTVLNASAPTVSGFSPGNGCYGIPVVITGTNFGGATYVAFNGCPGSFTINSSTKITATLPQSATTGKITVTNNIGTGTSVFNFNVTACRQSDTEANSEKMDAEVFPNPSNGKITVKFNSISSEKYSMNVIDLTGRSAFTENVNAEDGNNLFELDLSNLTKGMYLLVLQNAELKKQIKLMLN